MRILVTNDDGMHAAALPALVRYCRQMGEVFVCVPDRENSGRSHAIEIRQPIRARRVQIAEDIEGWAVESTPADCVRFAVLALKETFDLVISGVNCGWNVGTDIMYSGTVGAAFEAVNCGMRALAISTPPEGYAHATSELDRVFAYIGERRLFEYNPIYNINIPPVAGEIRITRQGGPFYSDAYLPEEGDMYRPTAVLVYEDQGDDTLDIDAVHHGFISISPLTTERVNMDVYRRLTEG